jgi:tRNA 2-thiouridine synthesizing protein C
VNSSNKKSQLVLIRRSPYGSSLARAALDAALAAAAFDQAVSVLFLGDGVLQLLPDQDSIAIDARNIGKLIASMPLYDIEKVYVDATALARFSLRAEDLPQVVVPLDDAALHRLITDHDHVLEF